MSHRFSVLAQSSLGRRARWRRLYLQQVFGAMPHRSGSHRRPGHVMTVTRLGRAAQLPLKHPNRDHLLKEAGFRSLCDAWADTTTALGRTVCYQAAIYPRGGAARAFEITRVVLSRSSACRDRVWRGDACISGARTRTVFFDRCCRTRRLPRDVTCPVADRGSTSWIMRR